MGRVRLFPAKFPRLPGRLLGSHAPRLRLFEKFLLLLRQLPSIPLLFKKRARLFHLRAAAAALAGAHLLGHLLLLPRQLLTAIHLVPDAAHFLPIRRAGVSARFPLALGLVEIFLLLVAEFFAGLRALEESLRALPINRLRRAEGCGESEGEEKGDDAFHGVE